MYAKRKKIRVPSDRRFSFGVKCLVATNGKWNINYSTPSFFHQKNDAFQWPIMHLIDQSHDTQQTNTKTPLCGYCVESHELCCHSQHICLQFPNGLPNKSLEKLFENCNSRKRSENYAILMENYASATVSIAMR